MPRTTMKQLEGTLSRLATSAALPLWSPSSKVGLRIDHADCYGGYKVVMVNKDSSESDIFGAARCSASELWERMVFAIGALAAHHAAVKHCA